MKEISNQSLVLFKEILSHSNLISTFTPLLQKAKALDSLNVWPMLKRSLNL